MHRLAVILQGTKECVENAATRMTCPGLGMEVGASLGVNRSFYQGFFLAPMVTKGALKGAVFAANIYEKLGSSVVPEWQRSHVRILSRL